MKKNVQEAKSKWLYWGVSLALGAILALLLCLAMLFICSIGISNGWLLSQRMYQYTLVGCVVGCFVGGMFAIIRCRTRALLVALGVSLIFFLILMGLGTFFYGDITLSDGGAGLLAAGLCGGGAAGILGRAPRKKRSHY